MYAILQSGPLPDPHQCWIQVLYPRVSVGIQVSMRKYHFLPKFNFEFRGKISFGNPTIACSIFCRVLTIDYRGFADSSPIGRGGHTLYTTLTILYFRSTRTSCNTLSLFRIHYAHFWWNTPFTSKSPETRKLSWILAKTASGNWMTTIQDGEKKFCGKVSMSIL